MTRTKYIVELPEKNSNAKRQYFSYIIPIISENLKSESVIDPEELCQIAHCLKLEVHILYEMHAIFHTNFCNTNDV